MAVTAPSLATIKEALRIDDDRAEGDARLTEIAATAAVLANRQAPDAPADIAREAMLRFIGAIYEGPSAGVGADESGVWHRSGAKGLLAPWTPRRAGLA